MKKLNNKLDSLSDEIVKLQEKYDQNFIENKALVVQVDCLKRKLSSKNNLLKKFDSAINEIENQIDEFIMKMDVVSDRNSSTKEFMFNELKKLNIDVTNMLMIGGI